MNVCIYNVGADPADEGFCEACFSDLSAGDIGSGCMDWFEDFYLKVRVCSPERRSGNGRMRANLSPTFVHYSLLNGLHNWQGSCGHPARVPSAPTCVIGTYADRAILAVCAGLCYTLLGINFVTLIPLLGKQDEFGLIHVSI